MWGFGVMGAGIVSAVTFRTSYVNLDTGEMTNRGMGAECPLQKNKNMQKRKSFIYLIIYPAPSMVSFPYSRDMSYGPRGALRGFTPMMHKMSVRCEIKKCK
jgi:hypothetical protein